MRTSGFPFTGMAGVIGLLASASLACSSSASGPSAPSQPAVQESGAAVVKAGVTWDTAQEPPLHKIGGIPPADLTDEPKYGGVQLHGHSGWNRSDPFFAQDPSSERWPARVYGNGLLEWDLKCNCPGPELAESWKQVDDLTYDFKSIRPGAERHLGMGADVAGKYAGRARVFMEAGLADPDSAKFAYEGAIPMVEVKNPRFEGLSGKNTERSPS